MANSSMQWRWIRWGMWGLFIAASLFFPAVHAAEDASQDQIDFPNGLFQRGFYKEAVEEYKAYLTKFPKGQFTKTALYRMGKRPMRPRITRQRLTPWIGSWLKRRTPPHASAPFKAGEKFCIFSNVLPMPREP